MGIKICGVKKWMMFTLLLTMVTLLPNASAGDGADYYCLKFVMEADCQWCNVKPQAPWDQDWIVAETKIIEPKKRQDEIKLRKLYVEAPKGDDTEKEIEFTVYFKAQSEDLEFLMPKSNGTVSVKVFNMCGEKPYRIGTYTNADNESGSKSVYKMPLKRISKYGKVKYPPTR